MAADWMKLRLDLPDDPAVAVIAKAADLDCYGVVGRLVKIWTWANRHTTDGKVRGVGGDWLDGLVAAPGFFSGMQQAGWIKTTKTGLSFPHFDRHNSESAKARALVLQRVRRHREAKQGGSKVKRKCNGGTVTESLPEQEQEKEREQEKEKDKQRTLSRGNKSSEQSTHSTDGACSDAPASPEDTCVACQFPAERLRVAAAINQRDCPISSGRRQAVIDDMNKIADSGRNPMPIWTKIVKRAKNRRVKSQGGYIANAMASEAKQDAADPVGFIGKQLGGSP